MLKRVGLISTAVLCAGFAGGAAFALPVNGTGNLTSNVIYGSGNDNGSFTGSTQNGVELALRAHLRYDTTGQAQNTFGYDGHHTYTFNAAEGNAPSNRSIFNFDWSINTDTADTSGTPSSTISDFTYLLQVDTDPTAGVSYISGDPYTFAYYPNPSSVVPDAAFGYNSTPNGSGVSASSQSEFTSYESTYNVSQQSWNMGFGFLSDPQQAGTYTITLSALQNGKTVNSTSIDVKVVSPVPLPAGLPLILSALGGLALLRRKRRNA